MVRISAYTELPEDRCSSEGLEIETTGCDGVCFLGPSHFHGQRANVVVAVARCAGLRGLVRSARMRREWSGAQVSVGESIRKAAPRPAPRCGRIHGGPPPKVTCAGLNTTNVTRPTVTAPSRWCDFTEAALNRLMRLKLQRTPSAANCSSTAFYNRPMVRPRRKRGST